MRAGLALASLVLSAGTRLRRALHGAGLLPVAVLPAPVISVGNLSAGGTGKTPLVEHLARELAALGARPVVLSRGYGGPGPGGLNDEGRVLAENLPGLAQRQGADRAAEGRRALAEGMGDCLLLDDGLQHLRLARDLDVVALDARSPFRGGLRREGRGGLDRAGAVVLTRAGRAGRAATAALLADLRRRHPGIALAVTDHEPCGLVPLGGGPAEAPGALRGAAVFACAGIADPESFRRTLEDLGARVVGHRWFPDHGFSDPERLRRAAEEARAAGAERLLLTQKDAVKLAGAGDLPLPVAALRIRLRVEEGGEALRAALRGALDRGRARSVQSPGT